MTRFRLTLVLIAFAILSSGIAVPENQDTSKGGKIIGDIKDTTLRENYLSGVLVVCVHADGTEFEAQSDKDGHFERAGLPAGQYVVNIYKLGYEDRLGKPVSVIDNGRHYVPMTMNKLGIDKKLGGVLRFWAYNRTKPGGPMEGLEIIITRTLGPHYPPIKIDTPPVTGITSAAGQYRSDKLRPGTYIATLIKNDYSLLCPMTVQADRITDARIFLPMPNKNTDANVPQTEESEWANAKNVIHGRIHEMIPLWPALSDVKVIIETADRVVFSDTTNADGEYECRGLSAGRYLISLDKEGYIERKEIPLIVTNNADHALGVTEEGMFVSYAVVADGPLFKLTHGMRKK